MTSRQTFLVQKVFLFSLFLGTIFFLFSPVQAEGVNLWCYYETDGPTISQWEQDIKEQGQSEIEIKTECKEIEYTGPDEDTDKFLACKQQIGVPKGMNGVNFDTEKECLAFQQQRLKTFESVLGQSIKPEEKPEGKPEGKPAVPLVPDASSLNQLGSVTIQKLLGKVIKTAMGIMGTIAFVMFVYSGILWMTAGGNSEKQTQAIKILTWSALGVIVILSSYALTDFVFEAFRDQSGPLVGSGGLPVASGEKPLGTPNDNGSGGLPGESNNEEDKGNTEDGKEQDAEKGIDADATQEQTPDETKAEKWCINEYGAQCIDVPFSPNLGYLENDCKPPSTLFESQEDCETELNKCDNSLTIAQVIAQYKDKLNTDFPNTFPDDVENQKQCSDKAGDTCLKAGCSIYEKYTSNGTNIYECLNEEYKIACKVFKDSKCIAQCNELCSDSDKTSCYDQCEEAMENSCYVT